MRSLSSNTILARTTQQADDGLSKRIFWLVEMSGTRQSDDAGLNLFSLYSLTVYPQQLDSAVGLDTSSLRDQTDHIANIWGKDAEVSHESLQRVVLNMSRMFMDTLSLSTRAGNPEPCLLPLTANISDFYSNDDDSSLTSFRSSLVESFQTSLIDHAGSFLNSTPTGPLSPLLTPIVPQPLPGSPADHHNPTVSFPQRHQLSALAQAFTPARDQARANRRMINSPLSQAVPTQCPRCPTAKSGFTEIFGFEETDFWQRATHLINSGDTVDMTTLTPNTGLQDVLNQDTVMMSTVPVVTEEDLNFVTEAAAGTIVNHESNNTDNFTTYEELSRRYQYVMTVSDSDEDDEEDFYFHK